MTDVSIGLNIGLLTMVWLLVLMRQIRVWPVAIGLTIGLIIGAGFYEVIVKP